MNVLNELERRVQAGIAFFEKKRIDWAAAVRDGSFDIANPCFCILGFHYCRYEIGLRALHLTVRNASELGLTVRFEVRSSEQASREFKMLTLIWKRYATQPALRLGINRAATLLAARPFFIPTQVI